MEARTDLNHIQKHRLAPGKGDWTALLVESSIVGSYVPGSCRFLKDRRSRPVKLRLLDVECVIHWGFLPLACHCKRLMWICLQEQGNQMTSTSVRVPLLQIFPVLHTA